MLLCAATCARWEMHVRLALKSHLLSFSSHLSALQEKGVTVISQYQSGPVTFWQGGWRLHEVQKRGKIADLGMVWEGLYGHHSWFSLEA